MNAHSTLFFVTTCVSALMVAAPVATAAQAATLEEIREAGTIRIAVANEIPYGYIDPVSGEAMGGAPMSPSASSRNWASTISNGSPPNFPA